MRKYAADHNMKIIAETIDISTGRTLQRDGLSEALSYLESNAANVLIVYQLDRLTRSYIDARLVRNQLLSQGVELHYAKSGRQAGTSASEQIVDDAEARAAEIEREQIVERTAHGRAAKIAEGKWLGGGHVPFGYQAVGHGRNRSLIIDEPHAAIVRRIFDWFVNGDELGKPLSATAIARKLIDLSVPTPHDIRGWAHKKRPYGEWTAQSLHPILRNKVYIGKFVHNRTQTLPDGSRHRTLPDVWAEVDVLAVLADPDIWHAAQAKLDHNAARVPKFKRYEYLLSQRVSCHCGYQLNCNASIRTSYRPYLYYRCPGARRLNAYVCPWSLSLRADRVDQMVWTWMLTKLQNLGALDDSGESVYESIERNYWLNEQCWPLIAERTELEQQQQRLLQLYARGTIPIALLESEISTYQAVLHNLQTKIARIEEEANRTSGVNILSRLRQAASTLPRFGEEDHTTFEMKRILVEMMDVRVHVKVVDDTINLNVNSIGDQETLTFKL